MKILVTGGTGKVGTEVVQALLRRGESVRVLTRNKEAKLPDGAEVAIGDLLDADSVRSALNGVDKLFLLVGNVADELTQALLTVAVARRQRVLLPAAFWDVYDHRGRAPDRPLRAARVGCARAGHRERRRRPPLPRSIRIPTYNPRRRA